MYLCYPLDSSSLAPGFLLILEPFETDNATVPNPMFHFTLVDSASSRQICVLNICSEQVPRPSDCHQTGLRTLQQCRNHVRHNLATRHVSQNASIYTCRTRDVRYVTHSQCILAPGEHMSHIHFISRSLCCIDSINMWHRSLHAGAIKSPLAPALKSEMIRPW